MRRRWVIAAVAGGLVAVGFGRAAPAQPAAPPPGVTVLLGDPPYWLPVSGSETLTLLARHSPHGLKAYVALQRDTEACARSAKSDRAGKLTLSLAPRSGGGFSASVGVSVHQRGSVRACVWIARQPGTRVNPDVQEIPLLNGLFAASVVGSRHSYTLDSVYVLRRYKYTVASTVCGRTGTDPAHSVAAGEQTSAVISFGSGNCAADGSTFSFTTAGGRSLGSLTYTDADALASPAVVGHIGACDLNGADATSLAAAKTYIAAVGCSVGRVLSQPWDHALPRGSVSEVNVDGGLAEIAPLGTAVDLVLDG